MKAVTTTRYEAFDGRHFGSMAECRAYEKEKMPERLVGLTVDQVNDAITRRDPELGDVIERVAYLIAQARKEQGEFKRRKPGEAATATAVADGSKDTPGVPGTELDEEDAEAKTGTDEGPAPMQASGTDNPLPAFMDRRNLQPGDLDDGTDGSD